jgi:hypothetical protein
MSFSGFWKNVGKAFAITGKYALKGAIWASQHPEVIALVASAAKLPPNVTQGIETGVQVVGTVTSGEPK